MTNRAETGSTRVSLVLSGGVALGAYQAGAYAALHAHEGLRPRHIAGSSIGAVNAAIIAGNAAEQRVERLRKFWDSLSFDPLAETPWLAVLPGGEWRHARNWLSVLQTRLLGRTGLFQPRLPEFMLKNVTSIYDLAPLRAKLEGFIDFELLNSGAMRISVLTTDIETGQAVIFDTGKGDRIAPDHLLATCGFLPDFPPIEIEGRLLGDGALAANTPLQAVLADLEGVDDHLCFVADLFSPQRGRPKTLEDAAARRWDLIFANQTRQALESFEREYRLRFALSRLAPGAEGPALASIRPVGALPAVSIVLVSYIPPEHEAGPEKHFDFSSATLADRWKAGFLDLAEAVRVARRSGRPPHGISVHDVHAEGGNRLHARAAADL